MASLREAAQAAVCHEGIFKDRSVGPLLPTAEALQIIRRGSAEIIGEDGLIAKLNQGKVLQVKYGADPSAPDLHLGHVVVLRKLRQLQQLGHQVQFLIGDFTSMIGDPTGRSTTRPPLTPEQIQANARTYQDQVFKILIPEQTQVVFNSTWLSPMNFSDVIRLSARYTVARILERDDFEKRFKEGKPIGLHEFLYPLIQGYDSVALKSDVELCGTDQIFNCLVARALQQDYQQAPETIIAMPLLEGLDGVQKMSKSLGNYIGITEIPKEMYGKVMSLPDQLMLKYFRLLTELDEAQAKQMEKDLKQGRVHPRDLKARLAHEIVTQFHDAQAADLAAQEFDRIFKASDYPDEITEKYLSTQELKDGKLWIIKLLFESGLVETKAEAQRMIKQGAVQINKNKIIEASTDVLLEDGMIIQVGKRKYVKIRLKT